MWLEFINENTGAIQVIATIVLVVITAIYVCLTYNYTKFTKNLLKIELERDEKKAEKEKRHLMEHPKL